AKVDGVDVLHVGCNDLLTNMGKPGAFGDPAIVVAIERVIAAAKANGKYAGLGGERDLARQNAFIKKGVRFVTTQTDLGFLMAAAGQRTMQIRESLAKQSGLFILSCPALCRASTSCFKRKTWTTVGQARPRRSKTLGS